MEDALTSQLRKPKKLRQGDTIGIAGPASPIIVERLENGIQYLETLGYRVKLGHHVYEQYGYLAGRDEDRARDLNRLFMDEEVNAILCTRGGYGAPRILPFLDFDAIAANPKIFVGYSDITALQLAFFSRSRLVSFSGPMAAVEMGKGIGMDIFTENNFWKLLSNGGKNTRLEAEKIIRPGQSQGRLLGGCLSLICSVIGTPYAPEFKDAILFIEDVGEEPYKIDRNLTHLKLAGVLDEINGLVFGKFADCAPKRRSPSLTFDQIIADITENLDIPILGQLPYGHIDRKYTIPVGVNVNLDGEFGYLEILENSVVD